MTVMAGEQDFDREAATWVVRLDRDWTVEQEEALRAWLAGDPRRQGALLRAQAAWLTPDCITAPQPQETSNSSGGKLLSAARRDVLAAGAGALAASLVAGFAWVARGDSYSTAIGEIRHVPLGDGSIAAINTSSEIDVDFSARQRGILLKRGEAWFQVAKNLERPFVVRTGAVSVEAVGTAFSVRRRPDGAEVLVNEGVVAAWSSNDARSRIILSAGERAMIGDNAQAHLEPAGPSAIDRALAWRAGMIDLSGEPLGDAVAEFNRYNRQQLVLSDPALAREVFDGTFRTDDPEGFARAVAAGLGVPIDADDPGHIRIGARSG